jgi:hypothetical protein
MEDDEDNRIASIAALVAMFVVSVTIVALTFWSGDLFGPWTSVPPADGPRVEALQPMLGTDRTADPVSAPLRANGRRGLGARLGAVTGVQRDPQAGER